MAHVIQVGDASAAEGECEALLERACQAEPSSPEPMQVRRQGVGWCGAWLDSRQSLCVAAHDIATGRGALEAAVVLRAWHAGCP